jgi:RNA polymerase sigma-70 factor, ECF subfamily
MPPPPGPAAPPTGPLVTDPRATGPRAVPPGAGPVPPGPGVPPPDQGVPPESAPAPRAATGPVPPTGVDRPAPQGPHGTTVGELEPIGPGDPAPAPADDEIDPEVDDLDLEADDADTASGWALVRASQAGDTAAFGQLFDRYHEVVFRFVLFRLGDRTAAEDLTQETFVRAFRRISSVSYQGRDIGAWFVTIARNLVLDHVKSSRYRLESSTPEIADVAPNKSAGPGPEHEVIAGATHAELLRCVARLGDDQQECITLRFLQGLSVAETAEIMGRNEGAVKALQHRAVRRLAQLLPEGLR